MNLPHPRNLAAVTPREREAWIHLASGLANKQIADAMGISVKCVERHRERLYWKINVNNQVHAVLQAVRHRVVTVELEPVASKRPEKGESPLRPCAPTRGLRAP